MIGKCPTPMNGCPVMEKEGGCYSDTHHVYYPRSWYSTGDAKKFWELFTVQICRRVHNELHAVSEPPKKPTSKEMRDTIQKLR